MRTQITAALAILASSVSAWADTTYSKTLPAMIRQGTALVQSQVTLTDLTREDAFEGTYFKVVKGEDETAIPFVIPPPPAPDPTVKLTKKQQKALNKLLAERVVAEQQLRIKAATVYNTFTQSRLYFLNLFSTVAGLSAAQVDAAGLNEKVVIRLEMTEAYSDAIHYNTLIPAANGAITVPASNPDLKVDVNPKTGAAIADWGRETWFLAGNREKSFATAQLIGEVLNQQSFKLEVLEDLVSQDLSTATKNILAKQFVGQILAENLLASVLISQGVLTLLPKVLELLPTHIFLDAAMVPEIAADEYAHHALYRWLGLKRRFSIGEGYAEYFTSKIMGLAKLQDKAAPYSKGYGTRDGTSNVKYTAGIEFGPTAATSSFAFSMLNEIERVLGADEGFKINVRALITPYLFGDTTIGFLGPDSNLQSDLASAILASTTKNGTDSNEITRVQTVFHGRGM